jgi:Cdc6-like AAA superfamily ATPase
MTAEEIFRYGSWVFVFWVAGFLIKKTWVLLEGKIKSIDDNVTENKALNKEIVKLNKDITVIQAQIHSSIREHNEYTVKMWNHQLDAMEKLCQNLNGKNPAIKLIIDEIDNLKKEIRK